MAPTKTESLRERIQRELGTDDPWPVIPRQPLKAGYKYKYVGTSGYGEIVSGEFVVVDEPHGAYRLTFDNGSYFWSLSLGELTKKFTEAYPTMGWEVESPLLPTDVTEIEEPGCENPTNNHEESEMAEDTTDNIKAEDTAPAIEETFLKRMLDSQSRVMGNALILGSAHTANEGLIAIVERAIGDSYPDLLKSEAGRSLIQITAPMLVATAVQAAPEDALPVNRELVLKGLEAMQTMALVQGWAKILPHLLPMMSEIADLGKLVLLSDKQTDEDVIDGSVKSKVRVTKEAG